MIIQLIVIYDFIIEHTLYERSRNVIIATKKLIKLQQ